MWPRLRVFLSHAAHDDVVSERIDLALREAGHDVFFDRESLAAGEGYHQRIRDEIARADLVVFLVSTSSLREGSYCRTEMEIAEARWPHPHGRVLPVLLEALPSSSLPAYVTAVTYLAPRGNVVADTLEAVERLARPLRRRRRTLAGLALLACAAVAGVPLVASRARDATFAALPNGLGERARLVSASGGAFLVAATSPDELVELRADGSVRTLLELDAEPVALARSGASDEDELIAVATRSQTPLHVLQGAARDPLGPFEVPVNYYGKVEGSHDFATQPVDLAVHDERLWCVLEDEKALPAFDALLPVQGIWQLGFQGSYDRDDVATFGRAVEGARLCDLGAALVVVQRARDRSHLQLVAGGVLPWYDEPADVFRCVRDLAPGPSESFYAVACDRRLLRIARDDFGDLEMRALGVLEPLPSEAALDIDHRIVADGTRVVVAFSARDLTGAKRPAWTQVFAFDPASGVRAIDPWRERETVSLAISGDRCVVVLRGADGAWSAGFVALDARSAAR